MMAYQNGFVVSIIHRGKPVRELRGDGGIRTCSIPFGSEYKVRVKSNHDIAAKVSVTIDGTPVISGSRAFILTPHGQLDIERFVDSLLSGKRFKFVELGHEDVQDPTSDENGIIRVEIQPVIPRIYPIVRTFEYNPYVQERVFTTDCAGINYCSTSAGIGVTSDANMMAGATIEGSTSHQSFGEDTGVYDNWGLPTVIEIKLKGTKTGNSSPWKISNGCAFYEGKKLQGVKSVMTNTSGEVILYLESIM